MRASLDVAGIEVELLVPAGPLESVVASRYAAFLGAVRTPVCTVRLEPDTGLEAVGSPNSAVVERSGPSRFEVAAQAYWGAVDLEGEGLLRTTAEVSAPDEALCIVFALLAPAHDGLLLEATGVIRGGRSKVFLGAPGRRVTRGVAEHRPTLGEGLVLVRRDSSLGWVGASTPFRSGSAPIPPPRMAALDEIWLCQRPGTTSPADHPLMVSRSALVPSADAAIGASVLSLAQQLVQAVPTGELPLDPSAGIPAFEMDNVSLLFGRSAISDRPPIQTLEG